MTHARSPSRLLPRLDQLEPRLLLSGPPYVDAQAYHFATEHTAQAFSNSAISPAAGEILHNAWADSLILDSNGVGVLDAIYSQFSVPKSGTYDTSFRGDISGAFWNVSSSLVFGAAMGGGRLWLKSWISGLDNSTIEQVLYETDLSTGALVETLAETAIWELLQVPDWVNNAADAINTLMSLAEPEVSWSTYPFSHTSSVYLESGRSYQWNFAVMSSVASASLGAACNVSMFDVNVQVEDVSIVNDSSSNHRPVLSNPQVTPLSGSAADTYVFAVHYYDEDGDPPYGDYRKVYLSGGRQGVMTLKSGSPADGVYSYSTTLAPGSYQYLFSFFDGQLDAVSGWHSGPYVSVATGTDLSLGSQLWDDGPYSPAPGNQHSDDDGVTESGEAVSALLNLYNTSSSQLTNVQATLLSSIGNVQFSDATSDFGTIEAHYEKASSGDDLNMFLDYSGTWNALPFTLHVTYTKGGADYVQDLSLTHDFPAEGTMGPIFQVDHVVWYDSTYGDGDGILESGEDADFDIYLKNVGTAVATQVKVTVAGVPQFVVPSLDKNYPDLLPGGPAQKNTDAYHFAVHAIPTSFSGSSLSDIIITYGGSQTQQIIHSDDIFNVHTAPWIQVGPTDWDFGVSSTSQDVTKTVTIRNVGTQDMRVNAIAPSNGDTTWAGDALPWTLPPGGSKDITVTIETSALNGTISRQVTVTSDGRSARLEDNAFHVTGLVSDFPPAFEVPTTATPYEPDVSGNRIVYRMSGDIYVYDLATGVQSAVCNDSGEQCAPRISGNLVVWQEFTGYDSQGAPLYDIYAKDISNLANPKFAVANSVAREEIIGIDGNYVAFTRWDYTFSQPHDGYGDIRNVYVYNKATGSTTQLTNYAPSGFNGVYGAQMGDLGGGLLAWTEYYWTWRGSYWSFSGNSHRTMKFMPGVEGSASQALDFAPNYIAANNGQFVYNKRPPGITWGDDIWLWQNGSVTMIVHEENVTHSKFGLGNGIVAYQKDTADGLFYYDLGTGTEGVITTAGVTSQPARMDGHVVTWRISNGQRLYYAFLNEPDISVAASDIAFSNENPIEGASLDVTVTVHNLAATAATGPVTVRLYDGNPDVGGTQLGSDRSIPGGIGARGQASVVFTSIPTCLEGTHSIYARVLPVGNENPGNNTTSRDLTARDSDTQGPSITNVVIAEFNGDGDGIIGADEEIQISWSLSDPSGIASTQLLVDGNSVTPVYGLSGGNPINANCYAILGPLTAGQHAYEIRATDADNSPASSQYNGSFNVVTAEEITILYDASALTDGQATVIDFGTVFQDSAGVQGIFLVRNDGQQALSLGAITVPVGFTVTGPDSSVLLPGSSAHFTVTLATGADGTFSGQVTLANSDGDEDPFNFPITGTVVPHEISVWEGAADSRWENGGNWSAGVVPGPDTVARIDGAAARQPVMGQNQTVWGLDLAADGALTFAPGAPKTLVTRSLTIAESGGVPAARLDIGSGAIVIDYTGSPNPIADVRRWILQAYNGMAWDSDGIASSTAALDPITYGIGCIDNAAPDLLLPFGDGTTGPLFGNVTPVAVNPESVLVKLTYNGDVTLDGVVDDNDVTFMNLFYDGGASSTHTWWTGDIFLNDGYCDDNDITILNLTYGLGIGSPLGGEATTGVSLEAPAAELPPVAAVAPSAVTLGAMGSAPDAVALATAMGIPPDPTLAATADAADSTSASGAEALLAEAAALGQDANVACPSAARDLASPAPPLVWRSADQGTPVAAAEGAALDLLSLPALDVLCRA